MKTTIKLLLLTSIDLFKKDAWGSWQEVSDRVRGGVSNSTFNEGVFRGKVDSSILQAGFAGQESLVSIFDWNSVGFGISESVGVLFNNDETIDTLKDDTGHVEWNGIEVEARGDGKIYSIRLLDSNSGSGRAFKVDHVFTSVMEVKRFEWTDFVESVRGRETGKRLGDSAGDKASIKKFGVMCQSYFGKQNGEFELVIDRISLFG